MTQQTSSQGSINIVGLLGIVFVTLKLCGVIDWSWWWVTAPFWGPIALLCAFLIVVGVLWLGCTAFIYIGDKLFGYKKRGR